MGAGHAASSRPRIAILPVTTLVGQAIDARPSRHRTFCAPDREQSPAQRGRVHRNGKKLLHTHSPCVRIARYLGATWIGGGEMVMRLVIY